MSRVTGGEFFDALVWHFAKVLGADYVYIGLVEWIDPKMMRMIAGGDRGNIVENLEYRLQDKYLSKINYIFATKLYENIFHGIN